MASQAKLQQVAGFEGQQNTGLDIDQIGGKLLQAASNKVCVCVLLLLMLFHICVHDLRYM